MAICSDHRTTGSDPTSSRGRVHPLRQDRVRRHRRPRARQAVLSAPRTVVAWDRVRRDAPRLGDVGLAAPDRVAGLGGCRPRSPHPDRPVDGPRCHLGTASRQTPSARRVPALPPLRVLAAGARSDDCVPRMRTAVRVECGGAHVAALQAENQREELSVDSFGAARSLSMNRSKNSMMRFSRSRRCDGSPVRERS